MTEIGRSTDRSDGDLRGPLGNHRHQAAVRGFAE